MQKKIFLYSISIFLTVITGSTVVLSLLLNSWKEESLYEANKQGILTVTTLFNNQIETSFLLARHIAYSLQFDPNRHFNEQAVLKSFKYYKDLAPSTINIGFANLNGKYFSLMDGGWRTDLNVKTEKHLWFHSVINGSFSEIAAPFKVNDRLYLLPFSVPIKRNGKIVGVLKLDIDLSQFLPDDNLVFFITNKEGTVMFADDDYPEWVYQNIYEKRPMFRKITDTEPLVYQDPYNEWWSASKQPLMQDTFLFTFTNQQKNIDTANRFIFSAISVIVFSSILLLCALFIFLRRELLWILSRIS